jgi:hypothetical protein
MSGCNRQEEEQVIAKASGGPDVVVPAGRTVTVGGYGVLANGYLYTRPCGGSCMSYGSSYFTVAMALE